MDKINIGVMIVLVVLGVIGLVYFSAKADNTRNEKHDSCMDTYINSALPLEEHLKECMN